MRAVNAERDYYEVYSTPTTYADPGAAIEETVYLPGGVFLSDPAEGQSKDLLFTGPAGTTTQNSITLSVQTASVTITVNALGAIY